MKPSIARVLIIAGSDSGGGAGIQADIKTVTALGGFAMTAITALTAQNTRGVFAVHAAPAGIVTAQIRAIAEDLGADVIKIGMLGEASTVDAVAEALEAWFPQTPLVLDPVMVAKGGHALLSDAAIDGLRGRLLPRATVVTPNAPEAARLVGFEVDGVEAQSQAGLRLTAAGAGAALVKGGHIAGDLLTDVLVAGETATALSAPRIETAATHGTGCTLASAIAVSLAQGRPLLEAVERARAYLREAMLRAPGLGGGHGPLAHGWPCAAG